jgi:L-cysteine S-thiosulfotransferase
MRLLGAAPALAALAATAAMAEPLRPYAIEGDAIPRSLTGRPGDALRGEGLVADRRTSLCLLCHQGPLPEPHAQGTLAPDLKGVGSRLSAGQLRLRIVDMPRLNPSTLMPAYYRLAEHERIPVQWRGRPILTAQDIEDIIAFLVTLKTLKE